MICLECKPSIEIGRKFIYKKGDWQRLTPPVKQTLWDLAKVYHTQRTLQHCRLSLVVVHLISLSMCAWRGEVLDISIIGLAIGGHVHMLPHLSSHTTAPGLVGFDCQLYVTTHSRLWWDFGRYGYPATFPSLNNDYVQKKVCVCVLYCRRQSKISLHHIWNQILDLYTRNPIHKGYICSFILKAQFWDIVENP